MRTVSLICFILELFFFNEAFELSNHFTIMNPPCRFQHSVFKTLSGGTVVQCAYASISNSFGSCSRFLWNQNIKTCMLHSNTLYPGTFSYTRPDNYWSTYSVKDKGNCRFRLNGAIVVVIVW